MPGEYCSVLMERLKYAPLLEPTHFRQKTTRRIKDFWSQFQHQVEAGKKTEEAPQCYRLNTSHSWEVTLGVIGQHWEGSTGQGWEGEVTFLRKVPEHAHKGKMVDNR